MSAQSLDIRMARLEGAYEQLDRRVGDLGATMASGFVQVDAHFARVESRLAQLELRLDDKVGALQWRMTSLIVATWVTTMATILFKH